MSEKSEKAPLSPSKEVRFADDVKNGRSVGSMGRSARGSARGVRERHPPYNRKKKYKRSNGQYKNSKDKNIERLDTAPRRVSQIEFGLMTGKEIVMASEINCTSKQLYKLGTRTPAKYGTLDKCLGVSGKGKMCETCDLPLQECVGHYGYIRFALPVYHIGYFKHMATILACVCKTCSRILLSPRPKVNKKNEESEKIDEMQRFRNLIERAGDDVITRKNVHKMVVAACKKKTSCPHCAAANGRVYKLPNAQTLKLLHDPYKREARQQRLPRN